MWALVHYVLLGLQTAYPLEEGWSRTSEVQGEALGP